MTSHLQTVQSANGAMDDEKLVKALRDQAAGLAMYRAACRAQGYLAEDLETPAADRIEALKAEVVRLRSKIGRLGSSEAFCGARALTSRDDELRARIDFARTALSAGGDNG